MFCIKALTRPGRHETEKANPLRLMQVNFALGETRTRCERLVCTNADGRRTRPSIFQSITGRDGPSFSSQICRHDSAARGTRRSVYSIQGSLPLREPSRDEGMNRTKKKKVVARQGWRHTTTVCRDQGPSSMYGGYVRVRPIMRPQA